MEELLADFILSIIGIVLLLGYVGWSMRDDDTH